METTRTLSLKRYPKQAAFVSTAAHFSAFIGGIYSAKSYSGSIRAALAAYGYIGKRAAIPTPNLGMITAPTYDLLKDATLRTFREIVGDLEADFNKNEMRMTLQNGSEVLFRSTTEPEKRRGPALAWAMMDEAALSPAVTFDILIGRLRQYEQLGYLWVCSTPRGQNWIWQKFHQAKNPAYKLFRAKTRDNPYVAEEIIQAWEQSYVGDFARQELEGEFVAFEGLIYPEFSHEIHVPASFDSIKPKAFRQVVAGVDWGFTNPGTILVFGIDGDGRMWGLHEEWRRQRRIEEWAETAKALRDTYAITRFYCDPSEPDFIRAFNEKGCKAVGADNEVIAGIQRVKSRLMKRPDGLPRILYPRTFVQTFKEYGGYQWKPGKGDDFQDEPLKTNDHCFVAGTMITTQRGDVAIEKVTADDYVLTRQGYQRVIAASMTNPSASIMTALFSDGKRLVGTGNHPVWVQGKGYSPLDTMRYDDIIETDDLYRSLFQCPCASEMVLSGKFSSLTGSDSGVIPTQNNNLIACILSLALWIVSGVSGRFIKKSGEPNTELSQMVSRFIMRMETTSTTIRQILNAVQFQSIANSMHRICQSRISSESATICESRRGLKPVNGTGRKRVALGIVFKGSKVGKIVSRLIRLANIAVNPMTPLLSAISPASVRINANPPRVERVELMTRPVYASNVANNSAAINTASSDSVPAYVVAITANDNPAPVFNLTIEAVPEYFANGILVHNCMDSTRYVVNELDNPKHQPVTVRYQKF